MTGAAKTHLDKRDSFTWNSRKGGKFIKGTSLSPSKPSPGAKGEAFLCLFFHGRYMTAVPASPTPYHHSIAFFFFHSLLLFLRPRLCSIRHQTKFAETCSLQPHHRRRERSLELKLHCGPLFSLGYITEREARDGRCIFV